MFKLYCVLRRVMDFATGVAGGEKRRINEQALREALYVAPIRGRHESGSPTRQKVRSLIDRLVVLGALQPIGPLVFQLPLATRDSPAKGSATNQQPDQQPHQQPEQQPINNQVKPSNSGALVEVLGGSASNTAGVSATPESLISNLPPESGKSKSFSPQPPKGGRAAKFDLVGARPACVSEEVWMGFCEMRKAKRAPLTTRACELIAKKLQNHPAPDAVLNQSTVNGWTGIYPEKVTNAVSQIDRRPGALSAVDRVKQAIAAREASAGVVGQPLAKNDGDVRTPLDGECRRVG